MEALARFHSLPLRPPNEWFAAAVELELGIQLEMMAVRSAMKALPHLPDGAYLSVNCSPRAAMAPELAALVDGDASRMVVEITEHEAIEDYEVLASCARRTAPRAASASRSTMRAPGSRACDTPCSCTPTS